MIAFRHLGKSYGAFTAVRDLEFSVERGEVFGFLGPNGAGKTTTIRMLMGILVPSSGSVTIDGLDCQADRVELKRRVGYLPDNPAFYDYLRGREIIEFSGSMHGLSREQIQARSRPLVERLEIGDALEDYAVNYSRGMKKKLALVCALLHEPRLLILDEPSSGLDPLATRGLNALLLECQQRGTTILLSSHLLDQVERLCGRMAILAHGSIAAVGTLEELRRERGANQSLEEIFFAVAAPERPAGPS